MEKEKKYIFLIPSICNIGGAILYLLNKVNYLRSKGWTVDVFYARKDVVLVKDLKEFSENCYPCLNYSIMYYRKKFANKIADEIAIKIGKANGLTVIESCTISLSTWGELIASKNGCKHICFAFEEMFELSYSQQKFVFYKHSRHELAGIRKESVTLMLKGSGLEVDNPESYLALTIPTVMDCPNPYKKELENYDILIGSLGRLDKAFVLPALIEISKYIDTHHNKKIAVVLIGDTKDLKYKRRIIELFKNKAKLIITGEIWPVPRELIKEIDVFVSSAGSATTTVKENRPTIAMSPLTLKPNGILDYTTQNSIFEPEPTNLTVSQLLYEIIDNHYCENHESLNCFSNYWSKFNVLCEQEFSRQVSIAGDHNAPKDYYDVFKIRNAGKRKWVSLYGKLVGTNVFLYTINFLKKHIGTLIKG